MNPIVYEQIMSLFGLTALWAFWYYLWKPQRVDILRQKLFALRTDLFELGASGAVPFNHPAYTQLRLLINGIIRFAHRANVPALVVTAAQSRNAPSNALAAWKKSTESLPEDARRRILEIHSNVSESFVRHIFGGSVILLSYVFLRVCFSIAKSCVLLLLGKRDISTFTIARARIKVDRETVHVASTAKVIEARVLHDEQRRVGIEEQQKARVKREHAYAH